MKYEEKMKYKKGHVFNLKPRCSVEDKLAGRINIMRRIVKLFRL